MGYQQECKIIDRSQRCNKNNFNLSMHCEVILVIYEIKIQHMLGIFSIYNWHGDLTNKGVSIYICRAYFGHNKSSYLRQDHEVPKEKMQKGELWSYARHEMVPFCCVNQIKIILWIHPNSFSSIPHQSLALTIFYHLYITTK